MGQAGGLRVRGVHAAFPRQPGQPALLPGAPSTAHPPLAGIRAAKRGIGFLHDIPARATQGSRNRQRDEACQGSVVLRRPFDPTPASSTLVCDGALDVLLSGVW